MKAKGKSSELITTAKRMTLTPKWAWAMDSKKAKNAEICMIKSDHELLITKKTKNSKMSDKIYSDENQSDLKNEKFDKNRKKKISKSYW